MKYLLFLLFVMSVSQVDACPMCNIHNYLYSSVEGSTRIYRGKVIRSKKDNAATIEVIEIIKNEANGSFKVGDLVTEYLRSSEEKIGDEYLFSNPISPRPNYSVLGIEHEWEVKYLVDSTRKVSSATEAIRLLECVSVKSNRDGLEYIKANFDSSYDSLYQRISQVREECQMNTSDFYNDYRLTNLVNALLAQDDSRTREILLQEIHSIETFEPGLITVDSLSNTGTSPMGEYLREILKSSEKMEYHQELVAKYVDVLNNQPTNSGVYFAYALSFDNFDALSNVEITTENQHSVTLGLLSTALWYRYYRQRDKINPILTKIEEINSDVSVSEFINKRFER